MADAAEHRLDGLGGQRFAALPRERTAVTDDAAAGHGLSIVVPLYNESASLARLHARLTEVAQKLAATRSLACEVI